MAELKTVPSYKGLVGDNYVGFVSYPVAFNTMEPIYLYLFCAKASHTENIGGVVYYRCGVCSGPEGTRVPLDTFQGFFNLFGQGMLTLGEITQLKADNPVDVEL
ncbi:hypothetical protein N9878_00320 [bacterium]|nr:hypothetical protein [bacterium]